MARSASKQLGTARMLLAQFDAQIQEFEGMNREARRTERGRDLAKRIDVLRDGQATWRDRVADLEKRAEEEK
ncbi:hypothetical protein [Paramicrobacterium chengjingii]|uniref:Uncharacterized protein n=1 Tax=Paramicrobacterium chengjingii TaxID=2769067 RepID=A0ABX6YMW4_9MICO|nr:hypothetical protein [Microbacterium chengjingii]QPZ39721.1 hypothetical protein HCR76_06660 [Microbacterium chengjingii]